MRILLVGLDGNSYELQEFFGTRGKYMITGPNEKDVMIVGQFENEEIAKAVKTKILSIIWTRVLDNAKIIAIHVDAVKDEVKGVLKADEDKEKEAADLKMQSEQQ